jgi:hypothetical protein
LTESVIEQIDFIEFKAKGYFSDGRSFQSVTLNLASDDGVLILRRQKEK